MEMLTYTLTSLQVLVLVIFIAMVVLVFIAWYYWFILDVERKEAPLDARADLVKILDKLRSYRYPASASWIAELRHPLEDIVYKEVKDYIVEMGRLLDEMFKKV